MTCQSGQLLSTEVLFTGGAQLNMWIPISLWFMLLLGLLDKSDVYQSSLPVGGLPSSHTKAFCFLHLALQSGLNKISHPLGISLGPAPWDD